MANDTVNASPADVRRLASALGAYKQEVVAAEKKVRAALGSANWHDSRKAQFESRYRDLQKRIDSFMSSEVDQMVKQLHDLARRLDEIRAIRM
jgi:hypothetical protein